MKRLISQGLLSVAAIAFITSATGLTNNNSLDDKPPMKVGPPIHKIIDITPVEIAGNFHKYVVRLVLHLEDSYDLKKYELVNIDTGASRIIRMRSGIVTMIEGINTNNPEYRAPYWIYAHYHNKPPKLIFQKAVPTNRVDEVYECSAYNSNVTMTREIAPCIPRVRIRPDRPITE